MKNLHIVSYHLIVSVNHSTDINSNSKTTNGLHVRPGQVWRQLSNSVFYNDLNVGADISEFPLNIVMKEVGRPYDYVIVELVTKIGRPEGVVCSEPIDSKDDADRRYRMFKEVYPDKRFEIGHFNGKLIGEYY